MQKQTEPLLLLLSKELWWSDSHTRSTNHAQLLLPLTQAQLHSPQGLWELHLCSWEEKSSLSCSLNWKTSLSSALTSLLETSTTPSLGKLWDSSGWDPSFSNNFHPDASGRININLAFDQLVHAQFSHTALTVGSLNSSEQKMRDPFPSWAVICARTSWAGLQGISGDFGGFLCYGNTPVYSRGGSRVPGLRSDPGYVPRYPHTPEPSTCSRMHWIWIISF